jgi:hypothetical protein
MRYARYLFALFAFALVALYSSVAWGAETAGAEPNALTHLADMVFQVLKPVLLVLGGYLALLLRGYVKKKTGVEIPEKQWALVTSILDRGITLAEEWSYKQVKKQTSKLTGPEKLEHAADYALDQLEQYGVVGWTRDRVIKALEARIGERRANGGKPTLDKSAATPPPLSAA